jgi:hypothetical protein
MVSAPHTIAKDEGRPKPGVQVIQSIRRDDVVHAPPIPPIAVVKQSLDTIV